MAEGASKDTAARIAEALEGISRKLDVLINKVEEGGETLEHFRREMWSLEKAIRGEPKDDES